MFFVFLFCVNAVLADSIWNETSTSPYSPSKAYKVGDIVTVLVMETTSAVSKAGTDTNASDSLSLAFNSSIASYYKPNRNLSGSAANSSKGQGSTSRTNNVTAKVASVVVKVLSNGNLLIQGEHRVEVNGETQTITISGMIRPIDVTIQNTIYSYQVAGAEVSVKGKGVVGDAENPGWMTRIFNWLF
jgi:flagellar L-ring protein FlgH